MFKKMVVQKRRELLKEYEKQERRLKELKSSGHSKAKAEAKQKVALTRKQEKNRTKLQKGTGDDDQGPTELLEKPREYVVRFRFPETSQLQPPILGLYSASFAYPDQNRLFKDIEFGIDMESRVAIVGEASVLAV